MNQNLKVYLIGLPGSGKTTLGKQVAEILGISFFDLDEEIERMSGLKVTEIFKSGESEFRKIESDTLRDIIEQNERFILATGGGAPCFNNNLDLMNRSGVSIFLDVPVDEIFNRVSSQAIDRPLLKGDTKERIVTLYKQRLPIYNQAHFKLTGAQIQLSEIIGIIS